MPLSEDALRNYVAATAQIELSTERTKRLTSAAQGVAAALEQAATGSLFDTEPGHLQVVLDDLSDAG